MESQINKSRNLSYDLMRCVAILLVATQHVWSMLDMDVPVWGMVCTVYRSLVDVGVPMFVAVSGALLLKETPKPLPEFFSKRFKRVIVPFLVWATAVYGVSVVSHQYTEVHSATDALWCYVPYLLENKINEFHWFVWMILALYLLTPVLQRAMQAEDSKHIVEYLLVLVVMIEIAKQLFPEVYLLHFTSSLSRFIGVYVGGYYVTHCIKVSRWIYSIIAIASILVCWMPGITTGPFTALTAVALTGLLYQDKSMEVQRTVKAAIANLSRYTYMIYLVHIPIIRAILIILHPTATIYWPPILSIVVVLAVALVCYGIDWILPKKIGNLLGIG